MTYNVLKFFNVDICAFEERQHETEVALVELRIVGYRTALQKYIVKFVWKLKKQK